MAYDSKPTTKIENKAEKNLLSSKIENEMMDNARYVSNVIQ